MIAKHTRSTLLAGLALILSVATVVATQRVGTMVDDPPNRESTPGGLTVVSRKGVTSAHENVKPFVVAPPQGGVYLAGAQKVGERTAVLLARSTDDENFDAPVRLSSQGMDLDLGTENGPNVAVGPNGEIFVVWAASSWAESKTKSAAQHSTRKPKAATAHAGHAGHGGKGSPPPRPGNVNIWLAKSIDDGRRFTQPVKVNDGPDGPEHSFPTVVTDTAGTVYVAWFDKRKGSPDRPGSSRVSFTKLTDGGRSFVPNVDATDGQEAPICHCCCIALAAHATRGVFVAFRNDVDDLRHMFLVHARRSGDTFTKPMSIEDTGWYGPT